VYERVYSIHVCSEVARCPHGFIARVDSEGTPHWQCRTLWSQRAPLLPTTRVVVKGLPWLRFQREKMCRPYVMSRLTERTVSLMEGVQVNYYRNRPSTREPIGGSVADKLAGYASADSAASPCPPSCYTSSWSGGIWFRAQSPMVFAMVRASIGGILWGGKEAWASKTDSLPSQEIATPLKPRLQLEVMASQGKGLSASTQVDVWPRFIMRMPSFP
jgi:hypothetical protein